MVTLRNSGLGGAVCTLYISVTSEPVPVKLKLSSVALTRPLPQSYCWTLYVTARYYRVQRMCVILGLMVAHGAMQH